MATHPLAVHDVIENAKSSRSTCQACRKKIAGGEPRYGIAFESYDEELAHTWYHLACGAKHAAGRFQVVYEKYKELVPGLSELYSPKQQVVASRYPYVEVAPTGRSKCLHCEKAIAQGEERLAVERTFEVNGSSRTGPGFLHLTCAPTFTQTPDIVQRARSSSVASAPSAKPAAPAPRTPQDFERGIVERPDDAGRYQVWADALLASGEPLGEVITASATTPALFKAALKKHQLVVLGRPACAALKAGGLELDWKYGVVQTARLVCEADGRADPTTEVEAMWRDLLSRPAMRFVRQVEVLVSDDDQGDDDTRPLRALGWALVPLAAAAFPALDTLRLGGWKKKSVDAPACQLGGVHHVFAASPTITRLVARGTAIAWGPLVAPNLKQVELTTELTANALSVFGGVKGLERLALRLTRSHVAPAAFLAALERFPSLRELAVHDYVGLDELVSGLMRSKLRQRLRALTVGGPGLSTAGVSALTAHGQPIATVTLGEHRASKSALAAFTKARQLVG
jgi:Poly(ADP-ribose) polymerase and DNA-Ligase Zn-finger region